MNKKVKTMMIAFLLVSGLFRQTLLEGQRTSGQARTTHPFMTTIWDDITHTFSTIRFHPADMYDSVFSNVAWSFQ